MKTIIRNHQLEIIQTDTTAIGLLRKFIIEYVRKYRYFVPYAYLAKVTGWSQPVLWGYLDAMGDQDVVEGRPRMDAFVGNDEPSNGHYSEKLHSEAHRTRWERIQYLNNEIIRLCNFHRLQFLQMVTQLNGEVKSFLRLTGMWYKDSISLRPPVKRIQEKEKNLFKKRTKKNSTK